MARLLPTTTPYSSMHGKHSQVPTYLRSIFLYIPCMILNQYLIIKPKPYLGTQKRRPPITFIFNMTLIKKLIHFIIPNKIFPKQVRRGSWYTSSSATYNGQVFAWSSCHILIEVNQACRLVSHLLPSSAWEGSLHLIPIFVSWR